MYSYEKKYKEALNKAKELMTTSVAFDRFTIERIFPELKESIDERIRQELIAIYSVGARGNMKTGDIPDKDIVAWLEKQGEQKLNGTFVNVDDVREDFIDEIYRVLDADSTNDRANQIIDAFDNLPTVTIKQDPCEHCKMTYSTCYSFPCDEKKAFEQGKAALKAINEEKVDNANKDEPKIKIGDWVVRKDNGLFANGSHYARITDIKKGQIWSDSETWLEAKDIRLWNISDAKDGDVLVYNNSIFIFNEICKNCLIYYGIYEDNKFHNDKSYSFLDLDTIGINNIHPATKEQRDLLFQKMKEAGYDWDDNKKEVKKIGKNPTNSIWHGNKCIPDEDDKEILVEYNLNNSTRPNHLFHDVAPYDSDSKMFHCYSMHLKLEEIIRWAYMDDILQVVNR